MILKEFIKNALIEIVNGVSEAAKEVKGNNGKVGSVKHFGSSKTGLFLDSADNPIVNVEFDIALAESKELGGGGGISVFLGVVNLNGNGASKGESSTHSRLKFSVPVVFPPVN